MATQSTQRQAALDDFYNRWSHDTNVINKWFKIQALSPAKDTLSVIQSLQEHELFDITNPNKIRSLLSCFAVANHVHFHAENGS